MKKNTKAFTLVEIMIVVALIGLLVALGVPGYLAHMRHSRLVKEGDNLRMINEAIGLYDMRYGSEPTTLAPLWPSTATDNDKNSFIQKQLSCPTGGTFTIVGAAEHREVSCSIHGTIDDIDI